MATITVEHNPSEARLKELGVTSWSTWSKEVSTFPWLLNSVQYFPD